MGQSMRRKVTFTVTYRCFTFSGQPRIVTYVTPALGRVTRPKPAMVPERSEHEGGLSVLTITTEPIIRPTYMQTCDVLDPAVCPIDITRTADWNLISVQTGYDTHRVIQEILHQLRHEPESIQQWQQAFVEGVDLRSFLRDPYRHLTPQHLSIPCLAHYIPPAIRIPWNRNN